MSISLFSAATTAPASRAVVIGGMHRSGTSLLASLFEGAGMSVGDRLLGHGNGNEAGHFEDLDFQEFHERVLVGNGLSAEGFTADAVPVVPEALRVEATRLAEVRQHRGTWGWKDPRTILFLDFWAEILPDARYVFVFRRPWEVADSFFRRGDPAFVFNPPHATRVWLHYNRLILQFVARHRDRCLIREMTQVVADPREVFTAVRDRLGVAVGEPPDRYRAELLHTTADGVHSRLVAASCPEAIDVYLRLRELAGSTAALPVDVTVSLADLAVMQWARSSRMEQDNAAVRREWVGQQAALTDLRTSLTDLAHRPELDPTVARQLAELGGAPATLRAA
jgi:hypothetical protein